MSEVSMEAMLVFGAIVAAGYAVQTVSGFGSTLVCVGLGALVLPLSLVPALVVPLSLVQNGWIVARHREGVAWRLLFTLVVPAMGAGMVVGVLVAEVLEGDALRIAFGVVVIALASRELWASLRPARNSPAPLGALARNASVFAAGILHGIYATGGPLLVYALGRLNLGKDVLRATLTAIWLVLNLALTGMLAVAGRVDHETLVGSALLVPAVPVGVALGEVVHRRVDERRFRTLVFALLWLAGVSIAVH